ncbi:MAG TPA: hypothetical protein VOA19_08090, partial [Actinomycetes bacterium]|nr:hypothetical protein [Actinomycetes bacterium]
MIPLSLSVLTVLFTSEERPRAVGVWAFLINLPVVAVGLLAVTVLLPESRSATRTGLDPVGVLAAMAAGTLVLVGFGLWERRLSRRPDGQPLVDLALFGSTSFTWGTILASVGVFALFGVLFTAPQYFQAIPAPHAEGKPPRWAEPPHLPGSTMPWGVGSLLDEGEDVAGRVPEPGDGVDLGCAVDALGVCHGGVVLLEANSAGG